MLYRPDELKSLRERLGFSQADFAARIGVNRSNVSRWELGLTQPSGSAKKLISALAASREGAAA